MLEGSALFQKHLLYNALAWLNKTVKKLWGILPKKRYFVSFVTKNWKSPFIFPFLVWGHKEYFARHGCHRTKEECFFFKTHFWKQCQSPYWLFQQYRQMSALMTEPSFANHFNLIEMYCPLLLYTCQCFSCPVGGIFSSKLMAIESCRKRHYSGNFILLGLSQDWFERWWSNCSRHDL